MSDTEVSVVEPEWLAPTWFLDHEHPAVASFAAEAVGDAESDKDKAVALFYAVRDGYRYDPTDTSREAPDFRASHIVDAGPTWCVPKSVLLTAAARHVGVPARLGFADVKNHLTTEKLTEQMGTDVFYWHGYSEFLIDGRWLKASSAFNIEMCDRFGVKALEFDGTEHALMHPFDQEGHKHMEYLNQRGSFDDLPLQDILDTFEVEYPRGV